MSKNRRNDRASRSRLVGYEMAWRSGNVLLQYRVRDVLERLGVREYGSFESSGCAGFVRFAAAAGDEARRCEAALRDLASKHGTEMVNLPGSFQWSDTSQLRAWLDARQR